MPSARNAISSASVPFATDRQCADAAVGSELAFEGRDLRTQDVPPAIQHALHTGGKLGAQCRRRAIQIVKRHHQGDNRPIVPHPPRGARFQCDHRPSHGRRTGSRVHLHRSRRTRRRQAARFRPDGRFAKPASGTRHCLPALLLSQRDAGVALGCRRRGGARIGSHAAVGTVVAARGGLSVRHHPQARSRGA